MIFESVNEIYLRFLFDFVSFFWLVIRVLFFDERILYNEEKILYILL